MNTISKINLPPFVKMKILISVSDIDEILISLRSGIKLKHLEWEEEEFIQYLPTEGSVYDNNGDEMNISILMNNCWNGWYYEAEENNHIS